MNTRYTVAFLASLIPASTLLAQEAGDATHQLATAKVPATDPASVAAPSVAIPWQVAYVNCDGSKTFPTVNTNDIICFFNHLAIGDAYVNCDGSTTKPLITANDFQCFLNAYSVATAWQTAQVQPSQDIAQSGGVALGSDKK